MKKLSLMMLLVLSLSSASAHIEYVEGDDAEPSTQEISQNRACFDELTTHGCADPGEDMKEFRTCLHAAFPTLTERCKEMMTKLYTR